jgi:hypothetical protein
MRKEGLFFRSVSLVPLIAFSVMACTSPFLEEPAETPATNTPTPITLILSAEPDILEKIGKENPVYTYFSDNTALTDSGETRLFIRGTEPVQWMVVVSNDTDEDDVVYVVNFNNMSAVTLFFRKAADFPYHIRIDVSYPMPKGRGLRLVPVARLAPQDFYFFPALF